MNDLFETLERVGWFPFFRKLGSYCIDLISNTGIKKEIAAEVFTIIVIALSVYSIASFSTIRGPKDGRR